MPAVVAFIRRVILHKSLVPGRVGLFIRRRRGPAQSRKHDKLDALNSTLCGRVEDFTNNHGRDNRIPSAILCQRRDLYVYLPPGYDPAKSYPLALWLHGAFGDEHALFGSANVPALDRMIATGCCPPMIVAYPDGTFTGRNHPTSKHSMFVNGKNGRIEDNIMCEIIPFLTCRYNILPGRDFHGIAGMSAGGGGAMSLALRHRDYFGAAASASGLLNLRYDTCSGDYFAPFSPETYRWKTVYDPHEVAAKFVGGLVRIHARFFIEPIFGSDPGVLERVMRINPADLLESTNLGPAQLRMYVRYGDQDLLNFDAHAQSFVWLAAQRGVAVEEVCVPGGKHDAAFFTESSAHMYGWLGKQFEESARKAADDEVGALGAFPVGPVVRRVRFQPGVISRFAYGPGQ